MPTTMFKYNLNMVEGLYFELVETPEDKEYFVKFLEQKNGQFDEIYSVGLKQGHWGKINRKYLSDYFVQIWDGEILLESISVLDYIKGKKVFISFESKSLGDTIAWVPYCLEFQNKYNCEVVVSTFLNDMFESVYPELTFIPRGEVVYNIAAMFRLGWYWHDDFEPTNPVTIPLQHSACNILHLPFKEICPRIVFTPKKRPLYQKYIAISTNATSQCKHWYYWQELVNELIKKGYMVLEVSKEGNSNIKGLIDFSDRSTDNLMNIIHHAEIFIGLGSGSSWLSWALKKQVVMICNFAEEGHEFTSNCIRITDKSVCHGCWNNPNKRFDRGDWYWCPEHKGTDRQYECHKVLTADRVLDKIKHLI